MSFVFIALFAGAAMVAFFTFSFASHCVLTVVEETAAGNRDVALPDEPLPDWIWKGWYLGWLILVWVAPSMLLAHLVAPFFGENWRGPAYVLAAAAAFWIAFPISLLSSLAAESRWTILHTGVLGRLLRRPVQWLAFMMLTLLVVLPVAGVIAWQLFASDLLSLVIGPLVLGAGILLYARLAGRLALLLQYTRLPIRRTTKAKPMRRRKKSSVEVSDPWQMPALEAPATFVQPSKMEGLQTPFEGEVMGYDVSFADAPKVPEATLRQFSAAESADVDDVRDERHAEEHRMALAAAQRIKPDAVEVAHQRQREKAPPQITWLESVLTLFASGGAVKMYAFLVLGLILFGALARAIRDLWPF